MQWIERVLEATQEAESPRQFVFWASLAAIAAVVRKQVWLDKFIYRLYPNIYVLLIAKSGMRKAFPVSLAKRLVRATKTTRVIAGRNSVQAIIRDLGTAYTLPGGGMITDAHGFLAAGEFSSFTVRDQDALTILTDLYDTHDHEPEWKNLLKSGIETLANPCITMLGASNQTHLRDKISEVDIDGGFIGRTLIIEGTQKYKVNPLTEPPLINLDIESLAEYLKEIASLEGPFQWSAEGKEIYSKWYMEFFSKEHDDTTGTSNRIHDHILKIAMLLSLSRRTDLVLSPQDVQDSITACLSFMANVKRTIMKGGKSPIAEQVKLVMTELIAHPHNKMSRIKLLQKHYGDLDACSLDQAVETLLQAGFLNQKKGSSGIEYELSPMAKRKYFEED